MAVAAWSRQSRMALGSSSATAPSFAFSSPASSSSCFDCLATRAPSPIVPSRVIPSPYPPSVLLVPTLSSPSTGIAFSLGYYPPTSRARRLDIDTSGRRFHLIWLGSQSMPYYLSATTSANPLTRTGLTTLKRASFSPPLSVPGTSPPAHPSSKNPTSRKALSSQTATPPFTTTYTVLLPPSQCTAVKTNCVPKALKRRTRLPLATRTSPPSPSLPPIPNPSLPIPPSSKRHPPTSFQFQKRPKRNSVKRTLLP